LSIIAVIIVVINVESLWKQYSPHVAALTWKKSITTQIELESNNIFTVEQQWKEPLLEEVEIKVGMLWKGGKKSEEVSITLELLKKGGSTQCLT